MRSPRSLFAPLVALLVLVPLGLTAGCTGSGSTPSTEASVQGIRAASSAAAPLKLSGDVSENGQVTGHVTSVSSDNPPSGTVQVRSADSDALTREIIAVGDKIYSRTGEAEKWSTSQRGTFTRGLIVLYDPFAALDAMENLDPAQVQWSTDDRGASVTASFPTQVTGTTGPPINLTGADQITVWYDEHLVVTGMRATSAATTVDQEVVDTGVELSPTAPSGEDLQTRPTVTRPRAEGPWQQVATGADGSVTWTVERADGPFGLVCWRLTTQPPYQSSSTMPAADEGICGTPIESTDPGDEQVQVFADSSAESPIDVIAVLAPTGSTITAVSRTGVRRELQAQAPGLAVVAGPPQPFTLVLEVTLPNGEQVACGPGVVSSFEDLELLTPGQVDALVDQPWSCLPD